MRIAVCCHRLDRTGAPIILFRLARQLMRHHQVRLLLPRDYPPGALFDDYQALGIPASRHLALDEVDVLLCNTLASSGVVTDVNGRLPTLYWVHEPRGGLALLESGRSDPAAFAKASHIVFPTLWQAETLYRPWLTPGTWDVVPYGIDTDTRPQPCPFRREPGRMYLFHLGIVQPRKGQDLTVMALERLANPDIEVFMAGSLDIDPESVAALRAYLETRPELKARVHFLGSLSEDQVNAYLQHCDAMIFPTRDDLITLAILEAMLFRRCVITSDFGPIPETVEHGISGLVSPVDDVARLADNIALAFADPALRQRLGEAARQRYEEKHSFARHLAGMEQALKRTIAAHAAGRRRQDAPHA